MLPIARTDSTHPNDLLLGRTTQQLHEFFSSERRAVELPLDLSFGRAFQQMIWRQLLKSPSWGETCSYGELAAASGQPPAARAAGVAVGLNPISLIVPCHRVLGADGSLTGYGGGLNRKAALLALERPLPMFAGMANA